MNDKNLIIEKLSEVEKLELGRFYFGTKSAKIPSEAKFQAAPRFDFLLSGQKLMRLPIAGIDTEVCLNAGDVQVSDRNSWEMTASLENPYQLLCIVPRNTFLRISHYEVKIIKGEKPIVKNTFYHTQHNYSETFRHTVNALCACTRDFDEKAAKFLVKALIGMAFRECSAEQENEHGKAEALFQQMRHWLENHYMDDISREILAKNFNITPSYVSRLFNEATGQSFIDFLTGLRIDFAKTLLRESDMTVYQIAEECGYKNYVYFVRRFREVCGIPPGIYRNSKLKQ